MSELSRDKETKPLRHKESEGQQQIAEASLRELAAAYSSKSEDGRKNTSIKTFRDLIVWQKSMVLVTEVYLATKKYPKDEMFGLVSQVRRCAVSIPSNIAEGYGRWSIGDYLRFLQLAMGSLFEVQTQLEIAMNLDYLTQATFEDLFQKSREIERMLSSLIKRLRSQ